jgi:hypothetical protein
MMNIPMPDSIVSVTTKYRNIIINSKDEFALHTKKGKVLKSPKWVPADCFCLDTGNPNFPMAVINMKYVDDIKIISGQSNSIRKFKVKGIKGEHLVSLSGTHLSCDCIGFKYHSKCKHVTAVREKL